MEKENKPFNDVIDHINKIEGNMAYGSKNAKKLPKPIKFIGFFIAGFFSITILLLIILNV